MMTVYDFAVTMWDMRRHGHANYSTFPVRIVSVDGITIWNGAFGLYGDEPCIPEEYEEFSVADVEVAKDCVYIKVYA